MKASGPLAGIRATASTAPDRVALVDAAGVALTYAELAVRVAAAAGAIEAEHGRGRCIVTRPAASHDALVTVLAIMASGNTVVPIADSVRGEQLDYIVAKCGDAPVVDVPPPHACESSGHGGPDDEPAQAMVLFTSGTTGQPKGVIVTASNLAHSCSAIAAYLDYRVHHSAAVVLPLYYSYSLISQVFAQLAVGGSAHLFGTLRNPIKVRKAVDERGIEVFSGVPSTFNALIMMHRLQALDMPGVRVVCSAGAPFDLSQHGDIKAIFPNARIFNNYGATEATPRISYVADDDPLFFTGSCGRPIEGLEAIAVDADRRVPLAAGEHGIIAVRGPNVTPGYLDDAERTAAAFLPGGWFVTNDLGWVAEGAIHVQGRADDIFDVGGEKVAPGEIEQALMTVPEVESCAVVGRADAARGHVPVAFLKLREATSKAELNRRLGESLAPIKIPVRYYRVETFPLTANGKLRRRDLLSDDTEFMRDEIS